MTTRPKQYRTFREFYPYYLSEHRKAGTRLLHFAGTSIFIFSIVATVFFGILWLPVAGIVGAYGCAWAGHFFIEHNRPATFTYPWFSLVADFRLYIDLWWGREKFFSGSRD